ncbi:MAG: hypothetical protein LBV36_06090 [Chromatiales bacterium]|jgi:hypothetical protein|nr:hypothetical protein [Chromatiales bacterium]
MDADRVTTLCHLITTDRLVLGNDIPDVMGVKFGPGDICQDDTDTIGHQELSRMGLSFKAA